MQRDAVLREDCEVSVGGIVEEGGCEEAARRGDERRRRSRGAFRVCDECVCKDGAFLGACDVHEGVSVDVDVVEGSGVGGEESVPDRGEVEVGVGEEEEGDLELGVRVAGGEVGEGGGGGGGGEEGLVGDLVGDWDEGLGGWGGEDMWGDEDEEDDWEGEEEGEGEDELLRVHCSNLKP